MENNSLTVPEMIEASGLSDTEIAAMIGCHPASVKRWRNGIKPSKLALLSLKRTLMSLKQ